MAQEKGIEIPGLPEHVRVVGIRDVTIGDYHLSAWNQTDIYRVLGENGIPPNFRRFIVVPEPGYEFVSVSESGRCAVQPIPKPTYSVSVVYEGLTQEEAQSVVTVEKDLGVMHNPRQYGIDEGCTKIRPKFVTPFPPLDE